MLSALQGEHSSNWLHYDSLQQTNLPITTLNNRPICQLGPLIADPFAFYDP